MAADPSPLKKAAKDIFAGTTGGIAVTLVGHPFDTIKVRLQTQSSTKPIYAGVVDCVKKTLQWEGPRGLYKGVTSPLAGQMFFRAILFGSLGQSKAWLGTNPDGTTRQLTVPDFYKAAAITGAVSALAESPIDFYKSQIQVQIIRSKADPAYKPPYTSIVDAVRQTVRTNGIIRGPYQGFVATLLRNTPANCVYLGTFETIKADLGRRYGCAPKDLPAWTILSAGGFGGFLYWLLFYPIDVVKSAIMTDSIDPAKRKYTGVLQTARLLAEEGGWRRFYRGFSPCLMRSVPANAIMIYTVDKVTAALNK